MKTLGLNSVQNYCLFSCLIARNKNEQQDVFSSIFLLSCCSFSWTYFFFFFVLFFIFWLLLLLQCFFSFVSFANLTYLESQSLAQLSKNNRKKLFPCCCCCYCYSLSSITRQLGLQKKYEATHLGRQEKKKNNKK